MTKTMQFLSRVSVFSVLGLLLFAILWRGGKSLEATWILVFVTWLAALTGWAVTDDNRAYPSKSLWLTGMLFLVWTVVSFFLSSTGNYGLDEVLRDTSFILLFFWMIRQSHGSHGEVLKHRIFTTVIIATILACVFGIAVYSLQPVARFVGTFFDHRFDTDYWPNAWGQYLLLAWPIVFLWTRDNWKKLPVLGFVLGCLFLSYSRGSWIAFAGQVALLGILSFKTLRIVPVRQTILKCVAVASLALITFHVGNQLRVQFHDVESLAEKVTFTAAEGTSSFSERAEFWSQSFELSTKKPFFGWGPYSFRFIQPRLQESVLATSDHPHNVFLKLAMERGWIAAILFALLLLILFIRSLKKHPSSVAGNHRVILIVAIAGVVAHNLIDYNLQFVGIALPFWLFAGLLYGSKPLAVPLTHVWKRIQKFAELTIAMILLLVALREGYFLVVSSVGRHLQAAGERDRASFIFEYATGAWFPRDLHLSRAQLFTTANLYADAGDALEDYFAENTEDARAWKMDGDLSLLLIDNSAAYLSFEHAYSLNKWNDLGVVRGYIRSLMLMGKQAELTARKPEIDQILRSFTQAIARNTHFVALSRNVEELEASTDLLIFVYPDQATMYNEFRNVSRDAADREREKLKSRPPGFIW